MKTKIETQTRRRITKTGLIVMDKNKVCSGYVLYSPLFGNGPIYLVDLRGNIIHQWDLLYPPLYGYLLPNGNLFYMGKARDETWDWDFHQWQQFKCGVLQEVDWDGRVIWEHRDPYQHHDARRTTSGGAIYSNIERVPDKIATQVKGGMLHTSQEGMWADAIIEVNANGNRIWEWHAYEHLDIDLHILPPNYPRHEWTHANTVVPLDRDHVMVCFKCISLIGIINKKSNCWEWQLGHEVLAQAHDPSLLPNGNVLVFDNGVYRKYNRYPFSRVLEINPTTNEIVWSYQDAPWYNFFSPYVSGTRRLPNGNTLITEGAFGRIFQVTHEKEIVWEYISPYFPERYDRVLSNSIFKATHYTDKQIPQLR